MRLWRSSLVVALNIAQMARVLNADGRSGLVHVVDPGQTVRYPLTQLLDSLPVSPGISQTPNDFVN